MNAALGWTQLALYLGVLLLITKPLGLYLIQVLDVHGRTWLDPLWKPVERLTYRLCGIDPEKEQHWKQYTVSMLLFSLLTMLVTYVILRLQPFFRCNTCSIRRVSLPSATTFPLTRRQASRPTPTGRVTVANPPCRISRRWWRWPVKISSPPRWYCDCGGAGPGNCAQLRGDGR